MGRKVSIMALAAVMVICVWLALRHTPQLDCYAAANEKISHPNLVLFGDSRVHAIARLLHGEDRGIGGEATPEMLTRFVQDGAGLNPKAIIVIAGINDVGRRLLPIDNETTANNLDSMIDSALVSGAKTACAPVIPAAKSRAARYDPRNVAAINKLYSDYCVAKKVQVIDVSALLTDDYLSDALTTDGIHLNDKGNEILAAAIARTIQSVDSGR